MVVPPGDVTASLSAPGCLPVSKTILALPITVYRATFEEKEKEKERSEIGDEVKRRGREGKGREGTPR